MLRYGLACSFAALLLLSPRGSAAVPPDDPLYLDGEPAGQWNLMGTADPAHPEAGVRGIDAEGAWEITLGRPDVIIAVLDSGVRMDHPDLAGNIDLNLAEAVAAGLVDSNADGVLLLEEAAPVVGDMDGDGAVTPLDVLRFCENGVDDDENGYVDDVTGWDFEQDDNDPTDAYGHGTGRAGIAAAVTGNGIGMAGVCPRCRILPVRLGPTFVAVPDKLAEAIAYAADRGAATSVMATGSLGNSVAQRAAVDYADERGVVQCAAIGNERSRHHHFPQTYENVIAVTGVTPDDPLNPVDWGATWNGTNYGAHAAVAAPTYVYATQLDGTWSVEGGTSSSVPHCAGVAALVVSRARDLGLAPSPRQVRQILMATAGDAPAWSARRGAGRLDARAAVEAVSASTLPPDARIASPRWYELLPTDAVEIEIDVRTPGVRTALEVGYGVEPMAFVPVAPAGTTPLPPRPPPDTILDLLGDSYAVTVRLTATDANGNTTVDRRTFYVHADDDAVPGFPIDLGASAEGGALLGDLDGDNTFEIVVATSDGRVHVRSSSGDAFLGWPVDLDPPRIVHATAAAHASGAVPNCCSSVFEGLALGDLDGDGLVEVIATALDGKVYAWDRVGARLPGFPRDLGAPIWAAPVIADVGGGGMSIVVATYAREVHVLDASAQDRPGWPVVLTDPSAAAATPGLVRTPAVGDLDGDGAREIVVATAESESTGLLATGRVYALRADATPIDGFPIRPFGLMPETFPVVGSGAAAAPVLADVVGDALPEIVVAHAAGQITAFDGYGALAVPFDHGSLLATFSPYGPGVAEADPSYALNTLLLAQPVAADITGDGRTEVIAGTMGLREVDVGELSNNPGEALTMLESLLSVWGPDGKPLAPFPRPLEGWTLFAATTVADVDGDGAPEVLAGSDGGWLHAFGADGQEAAGFPKFAGGWLAAAASVGDLDADGWLEVVTTTREGQLLAWHVGGPPCSNGISSVRWQGSHHDAQRTGDATADMAPSCPAVAAADDGCGCRTGGKRGPRGPFALLAAALALMLRRTRRGTEWHQ